MTTIKLRIEGLDDLNAKMDQLFVEVKKQSEMIRRAFRYNQEMEEAQMATIQDMEAEVAQNTDATESAVTLMNGLSQQLKDALAQNDPAAIQAVVDQLDANTANLAAAVTANTPADQSGGSGDQTSGV